MLIYCMKCRKKTETVDEKPFTAKNGAPMITGKCNICGTKKYRTVKRS